MTNGEIIGWFIAEYFPKAKIKYRKADFMNDAVYIIDIPGCGFCQSYSEKWWNSMYEEVVKCVKKDNLDQQI